ncbi:hypothetical protein H4R24_001937 [Coemansia sp. RSA 988]|nr:hypothetical protein H4R24_001937 [Coemansia sp. RSA 988]
MADTPTMQGLVGQAEQLYNEAVSETPPNRTKLDKLVDFLCANPPLLYNGFFAKALEAASIVVNVWHGEGDMQEDDNLAILTPPAAWGWMTMEETVCHAPPPELIETKYPQLALQFLEIANKTLEHINSTPAPIVRRAIQALTRFWPEIIRACTSRQSENPTWKELYEKMLSLAMAITQMSENTDDPALQIHLVKFLETEAAIFSPMPQTGDSKHDTLSLENIPESHAYISKTMLARRGELALQQLMRLLPSSDHARLCNTSFITAIISSIVYLMNLRPQFCKDILDRLTDWYAIINSSEQTMTHLQLVIIGKALRISLLHLYTRRYMGAYSELLENTLDKIGGPEWAAWQEQQARERDRRMRQKARERDQIARQQLMQGRHSARWVPAPEEGDEEMADQPAPGADGDFGAVPPPPPGMPDDMEARMSASSRARGASGQKRLVRAPKDDTDEDEEVQMRMLEENAKRVRLDDSVDVHSKKVPPSMTEEERQQLVEKQQKAATVDKEMEAEMKSALLSVPQFSLPAIDNLTAEARAKLAEDAIVRVINGSQMLQKFIKHKRLLTGATIANRNNAQRGHTASTEAMTSDAGHFLANGLTTNSGVLEDGMIMLVRLVTNCYIMVVESNQVGEKETSMDKASKWNEMHLCVEEILKDIVDAPRERYNLALTLLYEMWMAVAITDPELVNTPDKSKYEYTVLSLYLHWCERIFEAIVSDSIETTRNRAAAQKASSGEMLVNGMSQPPPQELDSLILDFIKEAPYIPSELLSKIEPCLKSPVTATLGFATLDQAIELRPPIFQAGLKILLTYSVHPDRATRIGCIRAVKKQYATSSVVEKIEKAAVASLKFGVDTAIAQSKEVEEKITRLFNQVNETQDKRQTDSDLAAKRIESLALRKQTDQIIDGTLVSHSELLLALSTKNTDLLQHVFGVYKTVPPAVQVAIRRMITPLVKSMVNTPGKIIPVLTKFPSGAETLALRIIFLLCADSSRVPPRELVLSVLSMCGTRNLDGNFVVFIVSGMERSEAVNSLPAIVKLLNGTEGPRTLVRESFTRLTTSYVGRPSILSPTELLIALHSDAASATGNSAMEAITIYEAMRKPDGSPMYTTAVFEAALKLLVEQENISPLMLQTADMYHRRRNGPTGTVVKLLHRLIERKVWDMADSVFEAFVKNFWTMQPGTLALIKLIPTDALKRIIECDHRLGTTIKEYVSKMPDKSRKTYKWLLEDVKS